MPKKFGINSKKEDAKEKKNVEKKDKEEKKIKVKIKK